MSGKHAFLDVDTSIRDRNLLIAKDSEEDEFSKLFGQGSVPGQLPPKLVTPTPGFCIKTRETTNDKKVFVNVCQTDAIPPPRDISEAELIEIMSTDEITDFRIPMSIGDLRTELDNKGETSTVCDVAVNPDFLSKIQKATVFKEFFIAVAFEGLDNKHKIETKAEKIILQNKKHVGKLQLHRIQRREIEEKMGIKETVPSVDDILGKGDGKGKIIEVISDSKAKTPQYRLFKKTDDENLLFAEVHLPYVALAKEISLDIGEDRIILESTKGSYFLDAFHPYLVDQDRSTCVFNKDSKFLTLTMPIKTC